MNTQTDLNDAHDFLSQKKHESNIESNEFKVFDFRYVITVLKFCKCH